ncbi:RNA recognition motif domain-containing protein [Streptomyces microflavus]|uniref:RNA recognition motif domain-containing protein n=1 Tax=Streptomyces microflavus TaxID=1919 RepID=UPI0033E33386
MESLHPVTTSRTLKNHFAQYNPTEATFIKDSESGASRGFGIVTFDSEADLEAAITTLNNSELDGRKIKIERPAEHATTSTGGGRGSRAFGSRRTR